MLLWFVVLIVVATATDSTYQHLSYGEITAAFNDLAIRFPDLVRITTAQKEFGLPSPGMCGEEQCETQIVHLTNFRTFVDGAEAIRPEVYISGALHGDERVGPHAVLEVARVLLEQRTSNAWLAHLLDTRSIFLTPMTNSLGYFANTREENGIDPNRDYPIDQQAELCMNTVCSRVVNELFRAHLFQVAITFHAGMEAIALEWGTMSRKPYNMHASPDDVALIELGNGLSRFAGKERANTALYPVGRMNDLVYPVPGGMEDWAYAGNWDPDSKRVPCKPLTFGGYAEEQTKYTDAMLRAVNVLVETSDAKWPTVLGESNKILDAESGTGHVPRNVRLALMLIDIVEPYVYVVDAAMDELSIQVRWEVGGAFKVDETQVVLISNNNNHTEWTSPILRNRPTRWKLSAMNRHKFPFKPEFSACFLLNKLPVEMRNAGFTVIVRARVDQTWNSAPDNTVPIGFAPQSHLVNARTNPNWTMRNAGKMVQGRLDWFSEPMNVVFGDGGDWNRGECVDVLFDADIVVAEQSFAWIPQTLIVIMMVLWYIYRKRRQRQEEQFEIVKMNDDEEEEEERV